MTLTTITIPQLENIFLMAAYGYPAALGTGFKAVETTCGAMILIPDKRPEGTDQFSIRFAGIQYGIEYLEANVKQTGRT